MEAKKTKGEVEENDTDNNTIESYSTKEIIREMFRPVLKKTTVLLIIIFIFIGYNGFGIFSVSAYFLDYLDEKENNNKKENSNEKGVTIPAKDIIINQILAGVADIISNTVGEFIGEIRKLGRKGGTILSLIVATILTIIGLFGKLIYEITNPIVNGITSIYVNLIMDYVVEYYPTKVRDTSSSLLFLIYRISCFLSNFISIGLYDIYPYTPFIIYIILSVLTVFFTWSLPHEMSGKPMH